MSGLVRARLHTLALMLVALGTAASVAQAAPPMPLHAAAQTAVAALAAEGEEWWTRSPDPREPVACATCHYDSAETRGWAASFPKFRPLPPPDGRVMTLLQANAAAVRRHYGLRAHERAAIAITAYLTLLGADQLLTPGIAVGQPVFQPRLRALAASVGRGEKLYARRCGSCHEPATVAADTARFPRVVDGRAESLEHFIERHRPRTGRLPWDSQPMADLIAFLVRTLADRGDLDASNPAAPARPSSHHRLVALASLSDAAATTVISGTVRSQAGQPLAGLALLEKGEIHNNRWNRGALVDATGRFRIELEDGGQYGLHVYSSGYIYKPTALKVDTGKTLQVEVVLVPEPTRANDPMIKKVEFFRSERRKGPAATVKMEVADPNGDLGPQVLAFNAATRRAFAMDPPRWVWSLKSNYPDGVYRLEVDTENAATDPRDWHFVVADHKCNTTDILSFPHEPKPPRVIR